MDVPTVRPVKAGWWNVLRPWTLHGAVVPVLIGGAVAMTVIEPEWIDAIVFALIMLGSCLFQCVANILNTYGDFVKGTDTVENETRSPELVTGVLKPKDVLMTGMVCLFIICIIGIVLMFHVGIGLMVYGLLGIFGVTMYTMGASYKYHGMGQISVFINFGILMPMGTYYVLTGDFFSMDVLLLSLPNAFMITGVLAGNELRDYYEDKKTDVGTLIGRMSYENGMRLYLFESLISFPILIILMVTGMAPLTCAIAFLTLYDAYILYANSKRAPKDGHSSFMLVPLCFKLNWHFGVLMVAGYLIWIFIP